MKQLYEIQYVDIPENEKYNQIINRVVEECFRVEGLTESNFFISITLTTPENIRKLNKQYRNIDKETDVLSLPMFEKDELKEIIKNKDFKEVDILGDMVISIKQVEEQAIEYGHSFERELSYMVVHSFYHLLGYDHIKEEDKVIMRPKEETVLNNLDIKR